MDYHPSYKTIIENIVLKALHAGHSLDHIQRNVLYFENKAPIWHLKKKGEATADQEKKLFWIDRCLWRHLCKFCYTVCARTLVVVSDKVWGSSSWRPISV